MQIIQYLSEAIFGMNLPYAMCGYQTAFKELPKKLLNLILAVSEALTIDIDT